MAYVRISTAITTAWSIATGVQEGALWGLTVSEWGVIAPIALVVAGIALIIGAFILAYNQIGWFRDFVDSVFAAIQAAIGAVVEWFQNEVAPLIGAVIGAIGDFFVQMYQSYIKPAWDWIVPAISDAIGWISENVVPVFTAIGEGISAAFGWIVDNVVPAFVAGFQLFINDVKFVFDGIVRAVQQIGPAFTWLYETIVKPVFTWIVDTVAAAVESPVERLPGRAYAASSPTRTPSAVHLAMLDGQRQRNPTKPPLPDSAGSARMGHAREPQEQPPCGGTSVALLPG